MKNVLFTIGFSIALLGQVSTAYSVCGQCQQGKKENTTQKMFVSDTESKNDLDEKANESLLADTDEENKDATMYAALLLDQDEENGENLPNMLARNEFDDSDDENLS